MDIIMTLWNESVQNIRLQVHLKGVCESYINGLVILHNLELLRV